MTEPERERLAEGWHLDKRVNVAHILTTAGIIASIVAWGGSVERRQAVLDTRQEAMEKVANTDRAALRDLRDELRETNRKLDRLLETLTQPVRR